MWVQQKAYKAVGAVLAAARARSGLTQRQLADRLSKPQSFVSNYESGQRRIDVLELIKITVALGDDPRKVFAQIASAAKHQTSR